MDDTVWLEILVLIILAILGFIGASYESALLASSRSTLKEMLDRKKYWARKFITLAAKGKISIRLRAALLNTLGAGAFILFCGLIVLPRFMPNDMVTKAAIFIAIVILIIQLLLRTTAALCGDYFSERLVVSLAFYVNIITYPLIPVVWLLIKLKKIIMRAAGLEKENINDEREAEVIAAVSDGELDGVVEEKQREMIEGIFELKEADVADIFVPRTNMTTLDAELPLSQAVELALEKGYSRVPVYQGTRDHIVGIFYVRDALKYWDKEEEERPKLAEILHEPLFVPETKKVSELLNEMRNGKSHMAVVLDEYGGTAGLVTIEDVLEEIVGEIRDEFDRRSLETEAEVYTIDKKNFICDGHTHVSDINKALEDDIIPEDDDYETAAGFVLDNLGHIPEAGESFIYNKQLKVRVIVADERKVKKIKISLLEDNE